MMLKHSRWSGRRLMPSGGGWMTPNPSGGVAACLVWNRGDPITQTDDTHQVTARSDDVEHVTAKPATTCTDVNV